MPLGLSGSGLITGFNPTTSGFGKVLQVVSGTTTTQTAITTLSYVDTGLTATITPMSITSKIIVLTTQHLNIYSTSSTSYLQVDYQLMRNSTVIAGYPESPFVQYPSSAIVQIELLNSISMTDSPATTSPVTYKTQSANPNFSTRSLVFQQSSRPAFMTLIEVAV